MRDRDERRHVAKDSNPGPCNKEQALMVRPLPSELPRCPNFYDAYNVPPFSHVACFSNEVIVKGDTILDCIILRGVSNILQPSCMQIGKDKRSDMHFNIM